MNIVMGLQIDVQPEELKSILKERLAYHTSKRDTYAQKKDELEKTFQGMDDELHVGKVSAGAPLQSLEEKRREHDDKAKYFDFMLKHVVKDEVYRLSQQDLVTLGISNGRYY